MTVCYIQSKMKTLYTFHHLGIPTKEIRPDERYSEFFKMFTSDHSGEFRIQFHRFLEGSPLHPIIQNNPHIALKVENLAEAIAGREVILSPYEPIQGYKVAIINDAGMPVELIETDLPDEALWTLAQNRKELNTEELLSP